MATGIYLRIGRLQKGLSSKGLQRWSDDLADDLKRGATSGEIMGGLSATLNRLRSEGELDPGIDGDVEQLLDDIERLLHPPNWVWIPSLKRYEPPGKVGAFEFEYQLTGTGWAEAYISDGRNWLRPTASYLSDSLKSLSEAVLAIAAGSKRSACIWDEEPGTYVWLFVADGLEVTIDIYWSDRGYTGSSADIAGDPQASELGAVQGRFVTTRTDLIRGVVRALDRILETHREGGYADLWSAHPFPRTEHAQLKEIFDSQLSP